MQITLKDPTIITKAIKVGVMEGVGMARNMVVIQNMAMMEAMVNMVSMVVVVVVEALLALHQFNDGGQVDHRYGNEHSSHATLLTS